MGNEPNKKNEPAKQEPEKEPAEKNARPAASNQAESQPATGLDELMATVTAMGKQISDLSEAVSAIANQGAVNAAVNDDNGNDGEDYPTIDLDSINKLMGV